MYSQSFSQLIVRLAVKIIYYHIYFIILYRLFSLFFTESERASPTEEQHGKSVVSEHKMRCRVQQSMGLYEEAFGERVTGLADIIHGYRYHDGTVTEGS